MSLILLTGNATLDIINLVDHYPLEDEELRASGQIIRSGGNAANSAQVLAQHHHRVDFMGVFADDPPAGQIRHALESRGIGLHHCPQQEGSHSPVSYINLNQQNGSRTIVHYRNLPEATLDALQAIDFSRYDWLHFEGRNTTVLKALLDTLQERFDQVISLEIEKSHTGLLELIPQVDVVMFSRAFVSGQGETDPARFLRGMHARFPEHAFTCSWGEQGAYALDRDGKLLHARRNVPRVIDTTGAGDTFNAGFIHARVTGGTLAEGLDYAVQLASKKVAQNGLDNLLV